MGGRADVFLEDELKGENLNSCVMFAPPQICQGANNRFAMLPCYSRFHFDRPTVFHAAVFITEHAGCSPDSLSGDSEMMVPISG